MKNVAWLGLALLVPLSACSVTPTDAPALAAVRPTLEHDYFIPQSTGLGVHRSLLTSGDGPNGEHIVFLNFEGVTVTHSNFGDDSAANQTQMSLPTTSRMIPAFDAAPYAPTYTRQSAINAIVAQYNAYYQAYNVTTTTTRPTQGRYLMVVVGGTPQDLHGNIVPTSEAGISPLDCGNNEESNISFVFSGVLEPQNGQGKPSALESVALDAAHESGHSFGLEHTSDTSDIMYPALDPAMTGFQGTSQLSEGSSSCGNGSTQDSNQLLLDNIGPSGSGPGPTVPKPSVAFVYPKSGATLSRNNFSYKAIAKANPQGAAITSLSVTAFGQELESSNGSPIEQTLGVQQSGSLRLRATATDANGVSASVEITFTVQSGGAATETTCTTSNDCNSPLLCNTETMECDWTAGGSTSSTPDGGAGDGGTTPVPVPQPGEVGASCTGNQECNAGICAEYNGSKFCTQACDANNANACPASTVCLGPTGSAYCTPSNLAGGGGCSIGNAHAEGRSALGSLFVLALAGVVLRRRSIARR